MSKRWKVRLRGISWDDGKGEYDVSDLPKALTLTVIADDEAEAVSQAMNDASETTGSLIEGVESAEVNLMR
jgi:hypothetical protein